MGLFLRLFLCGLPILLLDSVSKWLIYHSSQLPLPIFKNFFGIDLSLSLITNRGAALGLFSNFQIPLLLFRIVVILLLFVMICRKKNRDLFFPLALIIFGAIGNVGDFFIYGFVIDFIQCTFWGYPFPLFNVADICISLGVLWFFLLSTFRKKHFAKS